MPLLSAAYLEEIMTHDPEKEDNVLIDWMLALECIQDPIHSKMQGIISTVANRR